MREDSIQALIDSRRQGRGRGGNGKATGKLQ